MKNDEPKKDSKNAPQELEDSRLNDVDGGYPTGGPGQAPY